MTCPSMLDRLPMKFLPNQNEVCCVFALNGPPASSTHGVHCSEQSSPPSHFSPFSMIPFPHVAPPLPPVPPPPPRSLLIVCVGPLCGFDTPDGEPACGADGLPKLRMLILSRKLPNQLFCAPSPVAAADGCGPPAPAVLGAAGASPLGAATPDDPPLVAALGAGAADGGPNRISRKDDRKPRSAVPVCAGDGAGALGAPAVLGAAIGVGCESDGCGATFGCPIGCAGVGVGIDGCPAGAASGCSPGRVGMDGVLGVVCVPPVGIVITGGGVTAGNAGLTLGGASIAGADGVCVPVRASSPASGAGVGALGVAAEGMAMPEGSVMVGGADGSPRPESIRTGAGESVGIVMGDCAASPVVPVAGAIIGMYPAPGVGCGDGGA